MKPTERDQLLGGLEERTKNIYVLVEKNEKHLSKINDKISEHEKQIAVNKKSVGLLWKIIIPLFILVSGAIGYNVVG